MRNQSTRWWFRIAICLSSILHRQASFICKKHQRHKTYDARRVEEQTRSRASNAGGTAVAGADAEAAAAARGSLSPGAAQFFRAALQACGARSALQRTALQCSALQRTAAHCSALQRTATHCSALQRTAAHCSALQRTAAHYIASINVHCSGCSARARRRPAVPLAYSNRVMGAALSSHRCGVWTAGGGALAGEGHGAAAPLQAAEGGGGGGTRFGAEFWRDGRTGRRGAAAGGGRGAGTAGAGLPAIGRCRRIGLRWYQM